MLRLALYQPDIPQNTGTMLRMAACLGLAVEIIEPAGFDVSDRHLRRSGLDYLDHVAITRHRSWAAFEAWRRGAGHRLVLATTRGALPYTDFAFAPGDCLLMGRESAGVPESVHAAADARIVVPIQAGLRSLNVAVCAAMILGEAIRQTGGRPGGQMGAEGAPSPPGTT
ncbi:tRNA (cytidine/uridine-2'-O-)-methyltransferase [Methylobacterium sp. BE186]|uniref:tRNA (cytidine(34)-2'-O)-methyltransferase n=1 Tax=Methylobacterium sp. BE186 TaxID=2817715 RepID=UPI0028597F6F|nr:tRNA (cytidine(34)-2'-O)-methyltransferase [Methylobacterium sp. BE186]MDR7037035.1 tRNA (cytidine/uridine-2'-O-)-methyltransferase [Methylobacterium sp. BE186]